MEACAADAPVNPVYSRLQPEKSEASPDRAGSVTGLLLGLTGREVICRRWSLTCCQRSQATTHRQQDLNALCVAVSGGQVQGEAAMDISLIDADVSGKQKLFETSQVAIFGAMVQCCHTVRTGFVDLNILCFK